MGVNPFVITSHQTLLMKLLAAVFPDPLFHYQFWQHQIEDDQRGRRVARLVLDLLEGTDSIEIAAHLLLRSADADLILWRNPVIAARALRNAEFGLRQSFNGW